MLKIDEGNEMDEKQTKIDNKKKSLENANREIEVAQKQQLEIETKLPLLERELELRRRNAEIIYSKFKPLHPNWEYDTDEEYLANLLELNKMAFLKVEEDYAKMKDNMLDVQKRVVEQLKDSTAYREILIKELEELEKGEKNE